MVQLRTVADASRCLLLNRPRSSNLACPKDQLGSQSLPISVRLLKDSFVSHKRRSTFTFWHGTHLNGLGSARVRRGPGAWEIDKLYLPEDSSLYHVWSDCRGGVGEADVAYPDDGKQEVLELLEGLTRHAGTLGAQKLYLRVPWGSPVIDIAKQDGFFPYLSERLLVGNGFTNTQPPEANLKLRPRLPQDEYPLFQLYSITYIRRTEAARVVAVEAAVLLEAGWQALVDQLWVVVAPVEVAIARLHDDRGVPEDEARARIAAQMSNDERIAHADTVIHNAADLDALRDAITTAWQRLGTS